MLYVQYTSRTEPELFKYIEKEFSEYMNFNLQELCLGPSTRVCHDIYVYPIQQMGSL